LGLRRFPGTIQYREAGPTVVLTGRRPYREDAKKSPTRGEQQQPQGNNNKNNGHLYPTIPFRTDPGECSATGNLRVLRGKNRPPGLVDGRVSGRQAFCCTTENTEVTEALGSSPLTRPPCGSDSTFLFLVYDDQGFAALPLPQSLATDRNGIHRDDAKGTAARERQSAFGFPATILSAGQAPVGTALA